MWRMQEASVEAETGQEEPMPLQVGNGGPWLRGPAGE